MMTESASHRVVVIGPDGQPVGYADVPAGPAPTVTAENEARPPPRTATASIRPMPSASRRR